MRISKKTPALNIYQQAYRLYQIRILSILTLIPLYMFTNNWGHFKVNIWPLISVILIEVFINRPYKALYADSISAFRSITSSAFIDFAAIITTLHLLGDVDLFVYGVCYFISLVYCALHFQPTMTIWLAALASAIYTALLALGQLHIIPQTITVDPGMTHVQTCWLVLRHTAFFFLLAILVRFMAKAMLQKEEKLEDLIWELKATNEKVKYAYHLQTDYFARMSHEIRAPLNSILGFSQLLLESPAPLNEKQRDFIARIERSGRHLRDMINDVLDLSKIETKKMQLSVREANLVRILETVYDFFYEEASLKHILLVFSEKPAQPLLITCDELKVRQILYNLLSNALKFTPKNGSIAISLRKEPDGSALIGVEDSGPGIPKQFHKVIFEPYEQAGRVMAKNIKGTGLGLSITKQFVQMHGGKIWVESEPGQGCKFFVTLPVSPRPPAEESPLGNTNG